MDFDKKILNCNEVIFYGKILYKDKKPAENSIAIIEKIVKGKAYIYKYAVTNEWGEFTAVLNDRNACYRISAFDGKNYNN